MLCSIFKIRNLFGLSLTICIASHLCAAQNVIVRGTVRTETGPPPPDLQVVLISKDLRPRKADVNPFTGEFVIQRVSQGSFQIVACAGKNYEPQVASVEVKGGKSPDPVPITLPYAQNRQDLRGVVKNSKNETLLALAYQCEVATTPVSAQGRYEFRGLPKPPDKYQFATRTQDGKLVLSAPIPLTEKTGEVVLSYNFDRNGRVIALNTEVFTELTNPSGNTGHLAGHVVDPQGNAVVGAIVEIVDRETNLASAAITGWEGEFSKTMPPGNYDLRVQGVGFKLYRQDDVSVAVNRATNVDMTLEVGSVAETISVASGLGLPERVLGTGFVSRQFAELPLANTDLYSISLLSPVVHNTTAGTTRLGPISINGSRPHTTSVTVDGADLKRDDVASGFQRLRLLELPFDAIAEMTISFTELAGSGSTISAVTKSGTREVHGSGFYWNRNSGLASRDFFDSDKSHLLTHNFGFTIGGPIVEERLHYFGGFEGKRELQGRPRLLSVPSPAGVAAARSVLSANGLLEDPLSTRLLQFFPTPDRPGIFSNRTLNSPHINDSDNFLIRFDPTSTNHSVSITYSFARSDQLVPLEPSFLHGFRSRSSSRTQSLSGRLSSVGLNSRLVNLIGFRYDRNHQSLFPEDRDFNPLTIGLNTGVNDPQRFGMPFIKIVGFDALGSPIEVPVRQLSTSWQFKEDLSLILGSHALVVGGDFRRAYLDSTNDAGTRGRIVFDGSNLGDPLADFLAGFPAGNSAIVRGITHRKTAFNLLSWFITDSFKPTVNLALNFGLRYGFVSPPVEEASQLSTFMTDAGGLVRIGSAQLPTLYKRDLNNFAPRIGFTLDPTGSGDITIRANWGIYFQNPSLRLFSALCPCSNSVSAGVTMNPIGDRPVFALSPSPPIPFGIGVPIFDGPALVDLSVVDQNLKNPYVHNFYAGLQQTLPIGLILETSYSGSVGRQLYRAVDINQPTPGDPATRDSRRPFSAQFPQFGAINLLTSSGRSNYHAFRVSVERPISHGWWITGGYDFSKSIDEASDPEELPQDSRNVRSERALSRFDQRHRFILSWLYEFGSSKYELFNHWQISGVVRLTSGSPFTPLISFDNSGTATFLDRPNLLANPRSRLSRTQLYTAGAFGIPPQGRFGNVGRNSLTGSGLNSFDIAILKRIGFANDRYIEFRADVFNLFNHPNFSLPNNFVDEPAFGSVVATNPDYGRRRVQVGIRLTF